MADRYPRRANTGPGRLLTRGLGLPRPVPLHRRSERRPRLTRPAAAPDARSVRARRPGQRARATAALGGSGLPVHTRREEGTRYAAAVVDATGSTSAGELRGVHESLHPVIGSLATCARVVELGARPDPGDHHQAAAQQALEGFIRSLGKELRDGRTAQLIRFAPDSPASAARSTLRFVLSPASAYVSGQVVEVNAPPAQAAHAVAELGWEGPLSGRTALVTGCARGIGAAVAETLARDGAHVTCLDVPQTAGLPVDVAERAARFANPASSGINGRIVRVCGQSLLGA
jgi:3-oxoacyl-[acyl-carrier protein] reductase